MSCPDFLLFTVAFPLFLSFLFLKKKNANKTAFCSPSPTLSNTHVGMNIAEKIIKLGLKIQNHSINPLTSHTVLLGIAFHSYGVNVSI